MRSTESLLFLSVRYNLLLASALNAKRHSRSTIGDKIRNSNGEAKEVAKQEAKSLKEEISSLEQQLSEIDDKLYSLALTIPNDTHPDVPIGPEEAANIVATHGPKPIDSNLKRDHVSVGKALDLFDLEQAATVTGSSWYYLLNEGALLEMALTQYALSKAVARGFKPVTTPDVVKADVAMRCGFQPRDQGDPPVHQMYHLQNTNPAQPELVLSGTAEIPLGGLFANSVYQEEELPLKVVGLGRAFRSEAGARGADTRGLFRVHQFSKLELFAVCAQESSEDVMKEMVDLQVDIFSGLGLPLRILDMPTEELGASAYRKFDIEAWMPGRGNWGEISSTSNCTDYQARRLHIRYKRSSSSPADPPQGTAPIPFSHTLNGTAAAIPRLIVAILENGARFDEDGKVVGLDLPSALKPFWIGSTDGIRMEWY
ncbi:seryl-tRNA synthetase [Fomitiporia mediterranea MF3/22]|uniref:seryl-tRNA synthetase n=1 Tax=Fomitiporia mediterranea (strain MF3/22) TaxID=694068 RepID=UPI0004407340|nr:seryl-tRNA synthetase [Fomitiporia mediterranea MF3/22]EJD03657.1 seryl-tRNA synthetase [Fomitiporia mediterranea MF3/22]